MAVWKASEWQSDSGLWHCNDVSNLAKGSSNWWHQARACNLSPAAFIEMLIRDFHPDNFYYSQDKNVLIFSFVSQIDMRKYKNWINRQARNNNYII